MTSSRLVAKNTQLLSKKLYSEKPQEAASCPRNNQRETPSLCRETHCLRT